MVVIPSEVKDLGVLRRDFHFEHIVLLSRN